MALNTVVLQSNKVRQGSNTAAVAMGHVLVDVDDETLKCYARTLQSSCYLGR